MKRNSRTLGFLPKKALHYYLENDGVLGKIADNGDVVGYLLYAEYENRFRIVHLCVSDDFRLNNTAKELVNALKDKATTQKYITLRCRRDFPAHEIWPRLGFFALAEKEGRSRAGRILVQWYFTLSQADQLDLFQEKTSNDALDVVIDAQVLFHLDESRNDRTIPSKELYENYSEHSFFLQITEETYNEIDRSKYPDRRRRSRDIANRFPTVEYKRELVAGFEESLKNVLSKRTKSDISDIRQLAITASSENQIFVTEDNSILRKSDDILRLTGLQILTPSELIHQYETTRNRLHRQVQIVGNDLSWERIPSDLSRFPYERFLRYRERKGRFGEKLQSFLSRPTQFECRLLRSGANTLALRIVKSGSSSSVIHLGRVAQCDEQELLESFLVADTVRSAVKEGIDTVTISKDSFTPHFVKICQQIGFRECNKELMKFCFTKSMTRDEILSAISDSHPDMADLFNAISDRHLEELCSPVDLATDSGNYFLIPIKPYYAMSLTDRSEPRDDLYGGESRTLLRWDNVYYRSNTSHKTLKPLSRILWYVSAPRQEIIAVSRLDHVETGAPGVLFKRYKKFGILDWPEIYRLCKEDTSRKIMALQFSHTFPLRQAIPLNTIRKVYHEDGNGLSLQSASKITVSTFRKLYHIGFENEQ